MNSTIPSDFKCWAIIPAAGVGRRMGSEVPKQYSLINGLPMIEHSLKLFVNSPWVHRVIVAISEEDPHWQSLEIAAHPKITTIVGGIERADSVHAALNSIQSEATDTDYIFVHDAARPCLTTVDIEQLYQSMLKTEFGVILADEISDTVKRSVEPDDSDSQLPSILKTVPRENLWRALTPQVFPNALLKKALDNGLNNEQLHITDEASAVEALGFSPSLLQGRSDNIKVTQPQDLLLASMILKMRD